MAGLLAISLHAADDELRTSLVPVNKRYPIAELEKADWEYFNAKGRRLSIEWTMMAGVNDTLDQADKLASIARRLRAHCCDRRLGTRPCLRFAPNSRFGVDFRDFLGRLSGAERVRG